MKYVIWFAATLAATLLVVAVIFHMDDPERRRFCEVDNGGTFSHEGWLLERHVCTFGRDK